MKALKQLLLLFYAAQISSLNLYVSWFLVTALSEERIVNIMLVVTEVTLVTVGPLLQPDRRQSSDNSVRNSRKVSHMCREYVILGHPGPSGRQHSRLSYFVLLK